MRAKEKRQLRGNSKGTSATFPKRVKSPSTETTSSVHAHVKVGKWRPRQDKSMPLEKELALYEKMKTDLLKTHEGKFVLIQGEQFLGAFDSAENAYNEGVKRFGRDPFLVKKVTEHEEVYRNQALSLGLMNARI